MKLTKNQKFARPTRRGLAFLLAMVLIMSGFMPGVNVGATTVDEEPATSPVDTTASQEPTETPTDASEPEASTEATEVEETSLPTETEPEEETVVETTEETQEATPVLMERTVTASVNGLEFSVTGLLTETTTLSVQALGSDEADYIRDTVLGLDEQTVGSAYDITLYDNGEEIQPGEDVEVSIGGITAADSVYHLPHTSAADVEELTADAIAEAEKTGVKAVISDIAKVFMGKSTPEHEEVNFRQERGSLKFKAHGFSVYYIANGTWSCDSDSNPTWNSDEDTIYMAPGTTATISLASGNTYNATSSGSENITVKVNDENTLATIAVSKDAQVGNSAICEIKIGNYVAGSAKVVVISAEKAETELKEQIQRKLNDNDYPVWVAVRDDGKIPKEPSDQHDSDYIYYNEQRNAGDGKYADTANGIISTNIVNHEHFVASVDGSPTIGIYDADGSDVLAVLTANIDFDDFLRKIASQNNEAVYATDGKRVTSDNYTDYKIVPYVVKKQETYGRGWHIDCVIVPKIDVTLQYDINFPAGFTTSAHLGMPNSETGTPPATFIVGSINGLTTINNEGNGNQVTVTDGAGGTYIFTFQGWNTEPSGQGAWYNPNGSITINEDTTLYAIWNSNPAVGTGNLQITKQVNGTTTEGETFDFTVTLKDKEGNALTEAYNYKVYNSNNIEVSGKGGTISNDGTITLEATQHAVISNLPDQAVVTITENTTDYTPSWSVGSTPGSASSTVTIKGGAPTLVTCTNTPAPKTADVTIIKKVEGNMGDLSKSFSFTVTDDKGTINKTFSLSDGSSEKIEKVPVGTTLIITEVSGSYTMSADKGNVSGSTLTYTVASANDVTITVTNTYNVSIDTDVTLDTLPYIMILGIAFVGGAVLVTDKRRKVK